MKQFKIVFKFEFKNMIKSKTIIISTIIISIIVLLLTALPSFMLWFSQEEGVESEIGDFDSGFEVIYDSRELEEAFVDEFGKSSYGSEASLIAAVENREIESAFILHDYYDYTYITFDSPGFSEEKIFFEEKLLGLNERLLFAKEGIDSGKVYEIINRPVNAQEITLGKDAQSGRSIGFIFLLIMYMLIVMYGTSVATSVAREKDSRTMELLITSTKARTLILGKVAATGIIGILQVTSVLLAAVLGFFLNKVNYPPFILELLEGTMTVDTIMVYVLFSVLGYILYLFIYASLGSLVSKVEDVNSAVTPITLLFVLAYFVANIAMQLPDNGIIKVTSFIPFVSIFTMPIRYALTSVSLFSLLSSMLIMILTLGLFARLSIYIYRFGSLNYGNRVKVKDILRSFKR